jgi:hypothetical protein
MTRFLTCSKTGSGTTFFKSSTGLNGLAALIFFTMPSLFRPDSDFS